MKRIFFDLECVVNNTSKLVNNYIERIEPIGANSNLRQILCSYTNGLIDENEYRSFLEKYYAYRDMVLEEVDDKYKNCIDYTAVYSIQNVNLDVLKKIYEIVKGYPGYIVFYYNTEREYKAKESLCQEIFPNFEVIGIKYHQKNYQKNLIRTRTNKAKYILNYLKLESLNDCFLYDKSFISCREWRELGGESSTKIMGDDINVKKHTL